jgi:hypothetical protein
LIMLSKLTGDESKEEIYNRTRFAWKTNIDRARTVDFVIAHNSHDEIVGVFKPTKWLKADDGEFLSIERGSYPDRIGFIGEEADKQILEIYADCSVPARKKGAANPIRYIEGPGHEGTAYEPQDRQAEEEEIPSDISNARHTYLAGIQLDDDGLEDIAKKIYRFLDFATYELENTPTIYLVANKHKETMKFLTKAEDNSLIQVFSGGEAPVPSKEELQGQLEQDAEELEIVDGGLFSVWLAFEYPERDVGTDGELWRSKFEGIAGEFESITFVGHDPEIGDLIWQQWADGEFDEGAISNSDEADYYIGESLTTRHFVDLKCLDFSCLK